MITSLPFFISVTFILTTLATLLLFYWILKNSNSENTRKKAVKITLVLAIWLLVQAALTFAGVYEPNINAKPPKIVLFGVMPTILTIAALFFTKNGRQFIDQLPLKHITYLHTVRIAVEFVLYWLFLNKVVPKLMTFEGRNFDIIAGITAPLIAYFVFTRKILSTRILLIWNFICLGLLCNIVANAVLSVPSAFQQFAFDQPNLAILYFPFSWLPSFVVPVVLFSHLASIRQLVKGE